MINSTCLAAIVLLLLAVLGSSALSVAPGFVCPVPDPNPKSYLADRLPAPWSLTGTLEVEGHVMIDSTGHYDLVKVGNITGTFLQYYIESEGVYFAQYYINVEGAPFFLMNMTFSLLNNNEHCLIFSPYALVPYYAHGHQASDQFFYTTYFHQHGTGTGTFGDVAESEYFFIDATKVKSSNCLNAFNPDSSLKTMTCFNYRKISNQAIVPESLKRSAAPILSGQTVRVGRYEMPIEVIAPEHRSDYAALMAYKK